MKPAGREQDREPGIDIETSQMNQKNLTNRMNQSTQTIQTNRMNQTNQTDRMNQKNWMNKTNRMTRMSQTNETNQMNQVNISSETRSDQSGQSGRPDAGIINADTPANPTEAAKAQSAGSIPADKGNGTDTGTGTGTSTGINTGTGIDIDADTNTDTNKKIGKSIRITIRRNKKNPPDLEKLSAIPTSQLEEELAKEKVNSQTRKTLKGTLLTLATVASVAVLVATLWLPVLRIYGNSMTPTLQEGDLVVSMKQNDFQTGDVIAFYYNNKILVKRVIAGPGDYVDLDDDGNVYVNGTLLDEPYLSEKAVGETDLDYPYQVPDNNWFVMGDHRSVSLDSRTRAIGTIDSSDIVGKLVTRIWPLG